jgi:hypothetical protein
VPIIIDDHVEAGLSPQEGEKSRRLEEFGGVF